MFWRNLALEVLAKLLPLEAAHMGSYSHWYPSTAILWDTSYTSRRVNFYPTFTHLGTVSFQHYILTRHKSVLYVNRFYLAPSGWLVCYDFCIMLWRFQT